MYVQLNNMTTYHANRILFKGAFAYVHLDDSDTVVKVRIEDINVVTSYNLDA